jgi:sensor histidine kinase YesM
MASPAPTADRRWISFLRILGLATLLGLLQTGQFYFSVRQERPDFTWLVAAGLQMPFWLAWALLGPVVGWTVRRFAPDRYSWGARATILFLFGIGISLFHSVSTMALQHLMHLHPNVQLDFKMFSTSALYQLPTNMLAFGAVVGIVYATDFYRRYRERELYASTLSAQLAKAQLQALRMQLNPHFLFNAMNTIAMQVRSASNQDAVRMLAGLSDLLRYMLEDDRPSEVALREELSFVERYLAIEQVRFQDRLKVEFDVDPIALEAIVPTLLLQPLVENAIRHGISRRANAGRLIVRARKAGESLVLEVEDDGPGLFSAITPQPGTGVGLKNTRARLEQLYGADHSFDLQNGVAGGAIALVHIPFRAGVASEVLVS